MKKVKTARGKMLDIGLLATQYQNERAVSNVPVNARGDIIDNRGKVVVTREKVKETYYKNTVPGTEASVSIREDSTDNSESLESAPKIKKKNTPVEVRRTERARDDGSVYYEVEYSDGSMETVDEG
jgi:uncharacterized membrane protein YkoI